MSAKILTVVLKCLVSVIPAGILLEFCWNETLLSHLGVIPVGIPDIRNKPLERKE